MPRYRVAVRFGPWKIGDEFESVDPYHHTLAEAGRLLVEVDSPPNESLLGVPAPSAVAWSSEDEEN